MLRLLMGEGAAVSTSDFVRTCPCEVPFQRSLRAFQGFEPVSPLLLCLRPHLLHEAAQSNWVGHPQRAARSCSCRCQSPPVDLLITLRNGTRSGSAKSGSWQIVYACIQQVWGRTVRS